MFPRAARWGHAGKMVEIFRFPHVFMTASPRFPTFIPDFPDFLKPIIQVPEILGMLKHMGEETREALSDGQVAEVQAQKVRDRSWVDLGDQHSGYVRCWIFWRSTQLDLLSKGSKLLDCRPVAGFSGVSWPFRCKDQRNQSCWA